MLWETVTDTSLSDMDKPEWDMGKPDGRGTGINGSNAL